MAIPLLSLSQSSSLFCVKRLKLKNKSMKLINFTFYQSRMYHSLKYLQKDFDVNKKSSSKDEYNKINQKGLLKFGSKREDRDALIHLMKNKGFEFKNPYLLFTSFQNKYDGVRFQPIDYSLSIVGSSILEMKIAEVYTLTYPNLPYRAFIHTIETQSSPRKVTDIFLSENLEPYIVVHPEMVLNTLENKDKALEQLSYNTYTSLIGAIHNDSGYDEACKFIMSTYHLEKIDPLKMNRFFLKRYTPKERLKHLLYALRMPFARYQELKPKKNVIGEKIYESVVISENTILGKGSGKTQLQAEHAAAEDAIRNYYGYENDIFSKDENVETVE